MVNDIEARKNKISILDKIAFSCEQECRRTEQQLQELIDKKDRIEKLIANILNNDNAGYSKLKQIVKENVKSFLAENKQVISVAFTALFQTLKTDPEMLNVIYNILDNWAIIDGKAYRITFYLNEGNGENNNKELVERILNSFQIIS